MSRRMLRITAALALVATLGLAAPPTASAAPLGSGLFTVTQLMEWAQEAWSSLVGHPVEQPPAQEPSDPDPDIYSPGNRGGRSEGPPLTRATGRGGTIDPNGENNH